MSKKCSDQAASGLEPLLTEERIKADFLGLVTITRSKRFWMLVVCCSFLLLGVVLLGTAAVATGADKALGLAAGPVMLVLAAVIKRSIPVSVHSIADRASD